jgi:hypothetical protein
MPHHKFKVGAVVNFTPSRPGVATPGSQYEIIRVLPADGSATELLEPDSNTLGQCRGMTKSLRVKTYWRRLSGCKRSKSY